MERGGKCDEGYSQARLSGPIRTERMGSGHREQGVDDSSVSGHSGEGVDDASVGMHTGAPRLPAQVRL